MKHAALALSLLVAPTAFAQEAAPAEETPAAPAAETALPVEATAPPATAQEKAPHATDDKLGLVVGLKFGGGFGLGPLGATPVGELELGYTLPFAAPEGRDLQLFVAGQWAMPTTEGDASAPDERLPGDGVMHYTIQQQQAIIAFGLLYRIRVPTTAVRPYVAAGARTWLIESTIDADAGGEDYGTQTELDTEWGGYGALGVDWFLGPGAALLEVQGVYGSLDGFVLRETHLGGINVAVGYRLLL